MEGIKLFACRFLILKNFFTDDLQKQWGRLKRKKKGHQDTFRIHLTQQKKETIPKASLGTVSRFRLLSFWTMQASASMGSISF